MQKSTFNEIARCVYFILNSVDFSDMHIYVNFLINIPRCMFLFYDLMCFVIVSLSVKSSKTISKGLFLRQLLQTKTFDYSQMFIALRCGLPRTIHFSIDPGKGSRRRKLFWQFLKFRSKEYFSPQNSIACTLVS